ncbi:substrate-binding domain-containing protein [Streptomyces sp. NPDC090499]|uniref:substrate-binding domain-containing protein n=1 Tax=Streptomyces sp. NPDC090499 TaxID=3365965 RepID=UPI0038282EE3
MSGTSRKSSAGRRGATRAAILKAALESFTERGFDGASLRDIAERAGMTHAGLLHHFRGKDEILTAILAEQDTATEVQGAPELTDPYSGPDALLRFLGRGIHERHGSPELVLLRNELIAAAGRAGHPAREYFLRRHQRVRELLAANFRERLDAGTLRPGVDPEEAAALWLAVQDGLALQWRLDRDVDVLRALDQFVRLVFQTPRSPGQEASGENGREVDSSGRRLGGRTTEPVVGGPHGKPDDHSPRRILNALTGQDARRVTIQDVAREAGVSYSAVSKVIRGAYGVSPQMRARVTAAISSLGYRPHAAARAMRGRSYTIGVSLPELTSPFPQQLSQSVSRTLDDTPWQAILVDAGATPERQQRSTEALLDRQVDGLILIAPLVDVERLEELGAGIPTVIVALHGGGEAFDTVVDDDHQGARLMVDHLVALGHTRVLHTSQPSGGLRRPHVLSHTARRDGYAEAMRQHGLEPDVLVTGYTEQGGYEAAVEALSRPQPPTAIFAGADIAALGVLRAAEERGVKVPEDLTVVGYDNIYTSTIGRVSLTTVDQSDRLTGATAAKLLLERLEGRVEPVHHVVSPRLVVRGTSTPPRTTGLS